MISYEKIQEYQTIKTALFKCKKGSFLSSKFIKLLMKMEQSVEMTYRNCRYVGNYPL